MKVFGYWKDNPLFTFLLCQLCLMALAYTNDFFVRNSSTGGIEDFNSFQEKVILVLVVAPVFETIIFNVLLNELFYKFFARMIPCIVLSSILFGLIHYYSFTYIFFTFLAGIIFNGLYFSVRKDKGFKIAALVVFLLHFNHNLIGLLLGK